MISMATKKGGKGGGKGGKCPNCGKPKSQCNC